MPRQAKPQLPLATLVANITKVYNAATTSDVVDGATWYDQANRFCHVLASKYDLSVATVAGVVAALSPNNKWGRNKRDAEAMIASHKLDMPYPKVCTFAPNKAKAIAILEGGLPLDVLSGNKVRAFYQCIMGSHTAVCVDGHAYNIANANVSALNKVPAMSDSTYALMAEAYALVGQQVGQPGYVVQAVTWCVWRRQLEYGAYDL